MNSIINKEKILVQALSIMKPKIKKSLISTENIDREDLEQEIMLKVVEAVKTEKIKLPPTFSKYKEDFKK